MQKKRGFTLIELLIVIGILVVLAAVVVVILNPAELLRQARDSQRVSDLNTIKGAIGFYLANVASPAFASAGPLATSNATCAFGVACTVNAVLKVDNTGWVPIDFTTPLTNIGLRSPIAALPIDPNNGAATTCLDSTGAATITCQYAYKGSITSLTFKLVAAMESKKFTTAPNDVRANDGGTASWSANYLEVGNDLSIN